MRSAPATTPGYPAPRAPPHRARLPPTGAPASERRPPQLAAASRRAHRPRSWSSPRPPVCALAGVAARDTDDLHRRARDDADLPVDRRHRAGDAARPTAAGAHSRSLPTSAPALVDRRRPDRVRPDQGTGGDPDGDGGLPRVRARPARRPSGLGALRGGGHGISPALAYAPILVKEPTAYPAATLALFLMARWAATPTARGLLLAAAGCVLGVRGEGTARHPVPGARPGRARGALAGTTG